MKRAIVVVVVALAATVWAQGADPDSDATGSDVVGSDATGSDATGSAATDPAAGSDATDPAVGSDATGSAARSGSGSGSTGSGSTGSGATGSGATGSGATGSGSGSGSAKPPMIIIPADVTPPEVSAAASPAVLRLGDRFTLFVTAVYSPDGDVNLREPVELGGAFEVVRKRVAADTIRPDGKKVREWQLEVYAWDVGDLRVPPVAVTFTSQGKAGQVITNPVPLKVTGVLGDVVDDPKLMRANTPPMSLMSRDWFWLWVGGGIAAAVAGVLVFLYIRNRRRRRVRTLVGALVPSGPAPRRIDMTSERALEQLLAIENSGVLDRDADRKQGYAEMVDVIREYLGARYRVATLDLTTYELMRTLAKVAPAEERAQIEHWLERCDIVKYGGLRATSGDAHGVLDGARRLIVATTRAAEPPTPTSPPKPDDTSAPNDSNQEAAS